MRCNKAVNVLVILLLLGVVQIFAQTQTGHGWINGKIVEIETQKPIEGANVFYTVPPGLRRGAVSDKNGKFKTETLGTGVIVGFEVRAKGYYTKNIEIVFQGGKQSSVITLKKTESAVERKQRTLEMTPIPKTFKIMHRDAINIFELVQSISCARSASRELQTITAMGTPKQLQNLNELIKEYDIPLKQIWLEVLLIKATGNGGGKPKYPPEIDSIVNKLSSLFKFGKYTIIGRGNAMGLEGATLSFSGRIENDPEALVQHPFKVQSGLGAAGDVVKLQNLKVVITFPPNEIMTSINIKNGETVILGASRGKVGDDALITVVTAKIMQQ